MATIRQRYRKTIAENTEIDNELKKYRENPDQGSDEDKSSDKSSEEESSEEESSDDDDFQPVKPQKKKIQYAASDGFSDSFPSSTSSDDDSSTDASDMVDSGDDQVGEFSRYTVEYFLKKDKSDVKKPNRKPKDPRTQEKREKNTKND